MKKPINFNYSDFDFVKNIALKFPDTEESVSHEGTPSIKMRGKLLCRLHDSGDSSQSEFVLNREIIIWKNILKFFICLIISKIILTSVCGKIATIGN